MSILLTGGAGFIGAATAERLLKRGERGTLLNNFNAIATPIDVGIPAFVEWYRSYRAG